MRDGTLLYGALYRPRDDSAAAFPTLLIRSPYSTQHERYIAWTQEFLAAGYAVLHQDCRGRYESDGVWRPYVDEAQDGFDTQQWVGEQPWCDGTIGMFGISYPGFTQCLPAVYRSPYVKALVPIAHQEDNYGHLRYNGILQLENAMNFIWLGNKTQQKAPRELVAEPYSNLPLISALDQQAGGSGETARIEFYRDMIRHSVYDYFWSSYSLKDRYPEVSAPVYSISGWYDALLHEHFKTFLGWTQQSQSSSCRSLSRLRIGPWSHSTIGSDDQIGAVSFGPAAAVDIVHEHVRWYNARLRKCDTTGIDDEAPIQIFVMGSNVWRGEQEWPLARAVATEFALCNGGNLVRRRSISAGDNKKLKERRLVQQEAELTRS